MHEHNCIAHWSIVVRMGILCIEKIRFSFLNSKKGNERGKLVTIILANWELSNIWKNGYTCQISFPSSIILTSNARIFSNRINIYLERFLQSEFSVFNSRYFLLSFPSKIIFSNIIYSTTLFRCRVQHRRYV